MRQAHLVRHLIPIMRQLFQRRHIIDGDTSNPSSRLIQDYVNVLIDGKSRLFEASINSNISKRYAQHLKITKLSIYHSIPDVSGCTKFIQGQMSWILWKNIDTNPYIPSTDHVNDYVLHRYSTSKRVVIRMNTERGPYIKL